MEKAKVFLLGMLVAILLLFVMGATGGGQPVGRYQIESWGYGAPGFYAIDTVTGDIIEGNELKRFRSHNFSKMLANSNPK